jgi:cobalt-zinc-cadmium efflux system outer membrane protein
VLGGVRHLGDQQATGFIASLSAPIPIWNRNGPQIAAATADYNAALSRERTVRARLARDLGNAGQRLTSAYEAIQLAGKRALPAARQALEQLESGYRRGRFTYLDYTEGQRAVLEIQLLMNDTIRDYWKARLTIEGLPAGTGDSQP